MKTKIILINLLVIILTSCSTPSYLPSYDKIDINQSGSYIKVIRYDTAKNYGELIAIDSNKIIVLSETIGKCISIPINDIKQFQLRYAKPKHYGWRIPLYLLATIPHGIFLVFSAPINLIVSVAVTVSGEKAFTYNKKNMTYDKLKMFARFPQGIPQNIDLEAVK